MLPDKTSPHNASVLTSPPLGSGALCFFILAGLLFSLVPRHTFSNMTGEWFDIGWPFSAGALKVGFVSVESPRGMHPHLDPTALLPNTALWLAIIYGIRRFARTALHSRSIARIIILFAFLTSAVWFAFGAFNIASALALSQ